MLDYDGPIKILQYLQLSTYTHAFESNNKILHYSQSDI